MTDSSENITEKYAYDEFGKALSVSETLNISNPFRYVGKYGVMDEGNGLLFMRARYYDVETGRFISKDPLGFEGGDLNLYSYLSGNPITEIDPEGLQEGNPGRKIKKAVIKKAIGEGLEKTVKKVGAICLGKGYKEIGKKVVQTSVYIPIAVDTVASIHENFVVNANRDWVENLARTSIDITASAIFGIENLYTFNVAGTASSIVYSEQKENIQNSIINSKVADVMGSVLYDVFFPKPAQ
jgi:RHS repeat-associated protein